MPLAAHPSRHALPNPRGVPADANPIVAEIVREICRLGPARRTAEVFPLIEGRLSQARADSETARELKGCLAVAGWVVAAMEGRFAEGLTEAVAYIDHLRRSALDAPVEWLISTAGFCLGTAGDLETGLQWLSRAEEMASASGNGNVLRSARMNRGALQSLAGEFERAEASYGEVRKMASPDALQEIILLNNWAFSRIRWARTLAAGDPRCRTLAAGALDCADQAVDMAAPQQFVRWRAWALANRGHALALLGRTDEAEWTYRQCIPLAEANVRVQVVAMAGLGRLLVDTGRHEEGRSLLDEAYAKAPQDLLDISLDIVLESRAWLEARAGEFEQAMLWSRRCYERLEAQYRARLANVSQQVAVFAQMERERIEEMQRTEAAIAESRTRARETLLQDLHDGFGSQLTIARMRAERGALSNGEMIDLLDDCISDLYLVVDSIINTDGDLGEALRVLRNRLRGRLLGIETQLHWRVELGEALPLGHSRMIHVLRIVQEALANVLKHARAANAWVSAERDADGQLRVAIADDGTGFPEGKAEGNGLRGMRGRAEALSGTLSITSSGAGSRVELRLPV